MFHLILFTMKTIKLVATWFMNYNRKSDGKPMSAYTLEGDAESLALYKKEKGQYYREHEETGKPLFTAPLDKYIGDVVNLRYAENTNIKFFIDDEEFVKRAAIIANQAVAVGATKEDVLGAMAKTMVQHQAGAQLSMFSEETEDSTEDLGDM